MAHGISMGVMLLVLTACSAASTQANSNMAMQCEVAKCECRDPSKPFSSAAPVIWNQDGTAGCREGFLLGLAKEKTSPVTGLVLPTLDICASSGPRYGTGRLGRGAKTECPL